MPHVQERLATTLARITTRLVAEHDADSVLRLVGGACVELLGAAATGIALVDPRGGLRVVSTSGGRGRFAEPPGFRVDEGPCAECARDGVPVSCPDLAAAVDRWPLFAPAALAAGHRAVHAVPLRLDGRVVGALAVLHAEPVEPTEGQRDLVRLLADLAVLGLVQEPGVRRADRLAECTLSTLNDRVELLHAIGLVAGALGLGPDRAGEAIKEHSRREGRPVRAVVRALTTGGLAPLDLVRGP